MTVDSQLDCHLTHRVLHVLTGPQTARLGEQFVLLQTHDVVVLLEVSEVLTQVRAERNP